MMRGIFAKEPMSATAIGSPHIVTAADRDFFDSSEDDIQIQVPINP